MPLLETKGAGSAQGFGLTLGSSYTPTYIEDVFSTWLYTGNGSAQTITNGIDLSTKGGLVWQKSRNNSSASSFGGTYARHCLSDSARGFSNSVSIISTNDTSPGPGFPSVTATTSGFVQPDSFFYTDQVVSWTFRKQPKFFDVVTYTGTGGARMINHNLGSTPGMIIYKSTSLTNNWCVYHRSISPTNALFLNLTIAQDPSPDYFGSQTATATQFPVGNNDLTNQNGQTYVAYLFAHDAGGFGLTGTDNVISCGSFTTNGSGQATVSLGYEPQWVLIKQTNGVDSWYLNDNMREMSLGINQLNLSPNSSAAESRGGYNTYPNATGFTADVGIASATYIYIAIRRGPMKTPTTGTSVFSPNASSASANTAITTNFPIDLQIQQYRLGAGANWYDRLRGISSTTTASGRELGSAYTGGENSAPGTRLWGNTGFTLPGYTAGAPFIYWNFRRAPGFFDEVCYSGTSGTRTVTHNLGVVPELMIFKSRTTTAGWPVYVASLGNNKGLELNTTGASYTTSDWNNTTPTSTVFTLAAGGGSTNDSGVNYVAYLFASCPGVSKVGSYTGTGALQTIDCGFTGGARFVLIKRTNSTGNWFVYDSARGITSGDDPYLLLNSTAAEDTGTNYVDTTSVGFQVTAAAPAGLNASGSTYIFLAIA